ncbi:MAG: asparagine synthase (glutamine-hydrolyzing) [Terriglobales bacterium]
MCGIAGLVNGSGSPVAAATVRAMCATIVHRGPDDEGIYARGGVGLGMRRLSIIDVAGGRQPIANEDGSVRVVFNGEIYNFPQLRQDLESRGHRFTSHTDTEVIVHLYEEVGAECVQRLRGMFAFALYDEPRQRLLLARDRLGIKPLYYAEHRGRLLFGSEIKAILAVAPELAEPDPAGLRQYLQFGYIPDPATAFARIRKLPPGYTLEFERDQVRLRQYWDLPAFGQRGPAREEELLDELEAKLAEAVRIRLISEVPLGAFLSGGTDSSVVVALMARASSRPVKTFSIGFEHSDFDESPYARQVAERFGTEHCALVVNPDIEALVTQLTESLEEPFADSSMIPTYCVSKLAREHVTVALSGDGGDELFAGYDRYRIQMQRAWLDHVPRWAARGWRDGVVPHLPPRMRGRKFAYAMSLTTLERYLEGISFVGAHTQAGGLLQPDFLAAGGAAEADPLQGYRALLRQAPAHDLLSRMLYLDTKTYLPADILTKVDRMSMAVSLEARVPILDHEVVEWVTALPSQWKLHGHDGKYLLRKLAERVGIPREVIWRRKHGFALPLRHWMRRELKQEVARVLLEPRTVQRGYFRAEGVARVLEEHFHGARDYSGLLWQMLVLELWHRNYLERQPAAAARG